MKKLGLIFLFLLILSTKAWGTNYYVKTPANGGSNANDGLSWATAKATITAAMNLITSNGNAVFVAAGTYYEKVTFPSYTNIVLEGGYPAAVGGTYLPWTNATIIDGSASGTTGAMVSLPYFNLYALAIRGFTIRNGTNTSAGGAGGIQTYSKAIEIKDCIIENNTSSGYAGGIHISCGNLDNFSGPNVENCIIRNNINSAGVGGISFEGSGAKASNYGGSLTNCLIYGNRSTGSGPWGVAAIDIFYPAAINIKNCTIADNLVQGSPTNAIPGIRAAGYDVSQQGYAYIYNSIIWHDTGDDLQYNFTDGFIAVSYSAVEDSGDTGDGVIHGNPSFVGGTNYRLNMGSPCIDTGLNTVSGLPTIDLDGNPRIIDADGNGTATVDMGAYETPADTTPNAFTFTDQTGVPLNSLIESNSITVSGITGPASISITGGEYKIGAGSYTSTSGTVNDGQAVTVRQTSSGSYSTTTDATLTIGGVSDTFSLTTLDDTTPNAFSFTDQTGVPLNSLIESNSITVSGITGPASISITGGEYKIGAGSYTSTSGTLNNGETVTVRQTSSGSYSTTTNATLTIGGVSDTFSLTTLYDPYDGNGDGIPDSQQSYVTSLPTFNGSDVVTLASPDGTTLTNVQAKDNPSPADSPPGVSFPYGFFDFTVTGLTPGGATTVTLYLPAGAAPNTYYKFGPTPGNTAPHWYEFLYDGQTGAEINGNVIVLYFVDGLRGDDDLTADGTVIDQGGPGLKQEGNKLYLPTIIK